MHSLKSRKFKRIIAQLQKFFNRYKVRTPNFIIIFTIIFPKKYFYLKTVDFELTQCYNHNVRMNYHFFDYKYNISGFESDLFSTAHLVFIILAFLSVILLAIFARKAKYDHISVFLKVISIVVVVLEITKISWESYYDITTGRGFNKEGLIPVYTCSLFIYTLLFAAWGKGKVKDVALSFLTTVGLVCGAIGVVYCNGLNYYPFWTFGAFYSLFFHYSMLSVGVFLLASGYKQLSVKDIYKSWIPVVMLAVIAIPIDYIMQTDYMQLYSASGVPLMESLAEVLAAHNLRFIFTIIMLLAYMPMAAAVVGVVKLITLVTNYKR